MKNKFKKSVFLLSSLMMLSVGAGIISGVDSHVDTVEAADGTWTLVTDASTLAADDQIVIAASDYSYAISTTQNKNNRGQASITKNGDTITFGTDVETLTLETGLVDGTFALYTGEGYLFAASSSSNHLKTESTITANSSWKIELSEDGTASIVAQGSYSRKVMQYNQSSSLFSCYASANQKAICCYKFIEDSSGGETGGETPDPDTPDTPEIPEETSYVTSVEADKTYNLMIEQKNTSKNLYYAGGYYKTYYGAPTENVEEAVDIVLKATNGGYYVGYLDNGTSTFINAVISGSYINIKFETTPTSVWTFNEEYDTLVTTCGENQVYIGTYGTYDSFSLSTIDEITSETSYPARLYVSNNPTPDVKIPVPYTVTFNSNGGSDIDSQTVMSGSTVSKPSNPTKDGYTFVKWTLNGTEYDFNTAVNSDIELVAEWKEKTASDVELTTIEKSSFTSTNAAMDDYISYSTAKGGGTSAPAINGNEIRLYQNSAGKGGGTITITSIEGASISNVTIGSSMTTKIAYTIGDSTTKSTTSSLSANGKYTVSYINSNSITFYCMGTSKDSRLYVNYLSVSYSLTVKKCTVEFDSNGGSSVANQLIDPNGLATIPTEPTRENYDFVCWTYNGEEFDFSTPITKDITLVATWKRISEAKKDYVKLNKVNSVSELNVGDNIVLGATKNDTTYLMNEVKANNIGVYAQDISSSFVNNNLIIVTLESGTKEGTFAFKVDEGYLYAASSDDNHLKISADLNDNSSWLITFDENNDTSIVAQGENTRNIMRFNSSSNLIACYNSDSAIKDNPSIFKISSASINYQYDSNNVDEMSAIRFISSIKDVNTDEINSIKLTFTLDGVAADDIEITKVYRSVSSTQGNFENVDGTYYVVYAISGLTKTLHGKELVVKMTVEFNDSTTLIASRSIILGA